MNECIECSPSSNKDFCTIARTNDCLCGICPIMLDCPYDGKKRDCKLTSYIQDYEKQVPLKYDECEDDGSYICPCCFGKIDIGQLYCDKCGQKLEWSEDNE